MAQFTIEMLSDQCGVSIPNLRTWQRYGLLKPARDGNGRRFYDYSHLMRTQMIVKWLERGIPLTEITKLVKGEHATLNSQWALYQESLLSALEKPTSDKLRALLRRLGRELPAGLMVDNIIAPLRLWLQQGQNATQNTRRVRFDTLVLEYITWVLQTMRKRPAASLVIIPLNMNDPLAVWLEALRSSSEGFRIEVLCEAVQHPELKMFVAEHYMLYSDLPLTPLQEVQLQQWQSEGMPLFFAGRAFQSLSTFPSTLYNDALEDVG
ncbi:MerR family transcriptional regulator [Siccibacter colletis]|uniref:MerR family transcriptional regulator n=1 Tax=Siccibacter colletis TaxID=1505757 RepID=A0ABY6JIE5_9ENTR|nr:MerR family transcriptional regulator [Siccibacter colletis]UYU33615.1 MerR family transcriptional regulator [Siccibacter colletis]